MKIYYNGEVYTGEKMVEAFATNNGKFCGVGTLKELESQYKDAELVDLKGRFVCAGFNDSHMHVLNDGYFTFSIPYDKGFEIKVDGKKVSYNMVNKGFIGFPIKKGLHNIEVEFVAPNSGAGKLGSICGIVIFVIFCANDLRKRRN